MTAGGRYEGDKQPAGDGRPAREAPVDRKTLALLVGTGALVLGWGFSILYAFSPFAVADARPLVPWQNPAAVARGRVLYAAQCASCHGANGQGQQVRPAGVPASVPLAPPHDASGHTWEHPDFSLFQLTKRGVSTVMCMTLNDKAMPKFEDALSDSDILNVLAYVKSTWPVAIRRKQDDVNAMYASHNAIQRNMLKRGK